MLDSLKHAQANGCVLQIFSALRLELTLLLVVFGAVFVALLAIAFLLLT